MLRNREATKRVVEWSMELSDFDLHFAHTQSIKSSAMAEFFAKWTSMPKDEEDPLSSLLGNIDAHDWIMYFDSSYCIDGSVASVLLVSPRGAN